MTENVSEFISFHNANISNPELTASLETVSEFATKKNILLEDLSIEKHRIHFIHWCTSLASSQV
ncbi:MAG: hypothetical protein A3F35_03465 [Candidatus Woykebacteria bacterium RIFCSPHIGHO2_12_FULL_45_10]|uniref:Uncharacterized protein n=1 Tax=Candidatus Woykebacteria bacterium RIFCSPHIGHO2_12_FULL_45_10 TaxID=1802603 RepID=A0A1G1WRV4_9BACT|nr:MAG: hypothetical protein A3F35_03465 [Candidatus Woykebacteria bacterium RIFCSPHIGHO2_12_FULL_45_10]